MSFTALNPRSDSSSDHHEAAVGNTTPFAEGVIVHWERWALLTTLLLFVAVSLNNIHNFAFIGQDYAMHHDSMYRLLKYPDQWFSLDVTNRPLIYWIGVVGAWLTHDKAPFEMAALILVFINAAALYLFHTTLRPIIASPLLRLSAVGLVAFLPATLIASVVYAADGVVQLPFVLIIWSLLGACEARTKQSAAGYALAAGMTLTASNFAKFTFIGMPLAVAVVLALLWRWQRISWRRAVLVALLALVAPMCAGLALHRKAQRELANEPVRHAFNWKGTGEMSAASLMLVKSTDARIFDAPSYWDKISENDVARHVLLQPNGFSYPALLHLGIFTDVLDFADRGSTDPDPKRPEPQKTFSRWAVRLGLLFSVPAAIAMLVFCGRVTVALFRPSAAPPTAVAIWGLLALAWFAPLVLSLPFVEHVYDWGYWLPRLIIPALWGFIVVLFATLEKCRRTKPAFMIPVAVLVLLQIFFNIRSVWY